MDGMPKFVDYAGRFTFFEEACFVLVRDHGVHHLSRHQLAKQLGTSVSTVRRLLSADADLRGLALTEVGHRRRSGRHGRPPGEGAEAALWLLRRLLPDAPSRIAEELVWWRLDLAAPPDRALPLDEVQVEEGPLHHRFAIASHGFVPMDVLELRIEPAVPREDADGTPDTVAAARTARDAEITLTIDAALRHVAANLEGEPRDTAGAHLHALIEGLSLGVCLGRLGPCEAVALLRAHVEDLASGQGSQRGTGGAAR